MKLGFFDLLGIVAIWCGAGFIIYQDKDPLIQLAAIVSAYYLSKWIILKKES